MSGLELFMNEAKADQTLGNQLRNMLENAGVLERAEKFIALAKERGFQISEVELFRFLEKYEADRSRAFPEDTLESVAGGGGGIKDTDDKEWWEYGVEALDAILKGFGHCFSGESLVATPHGAKAIRDIKPGDEVVSLDRDGNKRVAEVTDVIEPCEMPIVEVTFSDGHKWNTTKTQWFYCGDDEYAAVMDDQGKTALTLDGGKAGVRSVTETERKEPVYDFIVDGLNVMFVDGIAAEGFSLS